MAEPPPRQFGSQRVVAGKYRILDFVGEGGMGEVYRAEDLSVHRIVALKALRPKYRGDRAFEARMRSEVRLGGQVSHPNVCRLFDLYEDEDHLFLTMELIRGESLYEVLQRSIGRLAEVEKLRIATDLCAGVEAIHRQDIVHRDLKTKNVLIDRDGRAVITDFGLADHRGATFDSLSGTWEYFAPERLAEDSPGPPTIQSDLFALGVVLYELFAGQHPFAQARTPEQLARLQEEGPSFENGAGESVGAAQGAIQRCLEPDPERRPASAKQVADLLLPPGVPDPFLHPDTPTPIYRLLLAPEGGLGKRAAGGLLASGLLGLVGVLALSPLTQPTQSVLDGEAPAALEARARRLFERLGPEAERRDHRFGYSLQPGAPAIRFWYRQSPRLLHPVGIGEVFVRPTDPPAVLAGMARVDLDPGGPLLRLAAVLPAEDAAVETEPSWRPLFVAAGLDPERFVPVPPSRAPPAFADRRWAWQAEADGSVAGRVRVEAASRQGSPVEFRVVEPRVGAAGDGGEAGDVARLASAPAAALVSLGFVVVLATVAGAAWRNLRRRTADRVAAFRLLRWVFTARMAVGLFGAQHVWGLAEVGLIHGVLVRSVLSAALVWALYLALEPLARRAFPSQIASWIRLLYGRARDPLVGHDLLWGGLFAIAALLWSRLFTLAAQRLGHPVGPASDRGSLVWVFGQRAIDLQLEAVAGMRRALGVELFALVHGLIVALFLVAGVLLLRYLMARTLGRPTDHSTVVWASRGMAFGLLALLCYPAGGGPMLDSVAAAGAAFLWLASLIRFGLLASVTATACAWLLSSHPLSFSPPGWAATGSWVPVLAVAALLVWAARAAISRSPLWRGDAEDRDLFRFGLGR